MIYKFVVGVITVAILVLFITKKLVSQAQDKLRVEQQAIFSDQDTLQLKHIFHHGTGPKNYRLHRRLDITSEYLAKHQPYFTRLTQQLLEPVLEENIASDNLDEIYQQSDWPEIHKGKNPFSIELPFKKRTVKQQDLKKETRQILLNRILITLEISRGCSDFKPDQFRLDT